MRKRAIWVLVIVGIALIISVFSSFGSSDRIGASISPREIIDGQLANEEAVLAALVSSDSLGYVSEITFHGVDVQLGVFDTPLQGFPVDGTDYVVVDSGRASEIPGQAPTFISTDVNGVDISGGSPDGLNAYDVATLTLRLDLTGVSASDNPRLVFYFKFMSEEVPLFVGSGYQDFFTVRAYDANGAFVGDIARLPDGNPFTIDNAWPLMNQVQGGSGDPLPPYPDPNDVAFNGCTDVRPVEFDLSGLTGQVCTIEFQIGDVGDHVYDSAVFLDGIQVDLEGGGGEEDRVDLGLVVVYGDNVFEFEPNRFRVQGNVHVNDFLRFDGDLTVDTATKTISGNCQVWFEDPDKSSKFTMPEIDISDVAVQFFIDASQDPAVFRFTSQISELGFEVAGVKVFARQLELYFNDPQHGYGFKADIYLAVGNIEGDPKDSGPGGSLAIDGFYATSVEGIWFDQAKLIVRNAKIAGGFGLDYMEMTYETGPPQRFAVDNATVSIKHWDTTVWGNLEVIGGEINAFGLGFELGTGVMMIPLPSPPSALYLQSLDAGIEGLVTGNVRAEGGIGFTYMPEIEVAGYTCHVVRCNVTGVIEEGHFNVTGVVSLLYDGWENAEISVDWWASQGVEINGFVDLAGIVTGTVYAKINDHFRCRSTVQVDMPWYVPFVGHKPAQVQLAWVDWSLGFKIGVGTWLEHSLVITPDPDCPYTEDCGWLSCADIPFTPVTICVDCGFDELLADTYSAAQALSYLRAKAPIAEQFLVAAGQAFAIARVDGEGGTIPYLELVDPVGNVITPALAISNAELYVYQTNIDLGEAYIAVRNPMPGLWTIQVPGTLENEMSAKNGLTIQALSAPPGPTIEVAGPAVPTTTSDQAEITWQGTSSTATTDVSLFFSDTAGEAGVLIADGLPVSGTYDWDVRGTAPGIYWIYGTIDDGKNAEVSDFGPATVTIEKGDPTAQVNGPATATVGEDVFLDATGSSDPWGADLDSEWRFVSVPGGSAATLSVQADSRYAVIVPDLPGDYQVEVRVIDPFGSQDFAQITVQVVSSPAALSVPQVGTISFVGSGFTLIATVTDQADNPIANETVHFYVISGPHSGVGTTVSTNLAGKAAFVYTGISEGIDTIQGWSSAETYGEAESDLRSEIGHVWIPDNNGDCVVQSVDLTPDGWHMIALPGELCSPCLWAEDVEICGDVVCTLCDDLDPCFVFYYDPEVGGYVMAPPANSICYHTGMGFWTRTYVDDVTIDAELEVATNAVEVSLENGWNQIGNPFTFAVASNALKVRCGETELSLLDAQANGWVSAYLFGYDTASGGYVMIDPTTSCLQPWNGYWMRSYQDDCILVIPPTLYTELSTAGHWLSVKELQARGLELPPPPPNDLMGLNVKEVLAGLTVRNVPNPICSEHTTTFKVEGKGVELVAAIRVDIYNQAGQKVFTQDINAKELEWHTDNDTGELLANGVYLYQVWVKVAGAWYPTGVHKLAVVR